MILRTTIEAHVSAVFLLFRHFSPDFFDGGGGGKTGDAHIGVYS
jgi:hypothetical protein